ncbi:hypothetical protein BKE30_01855 [Alkanindiges hydrocarboniclasticus]|jgi:hypothetical protein|uniref:Uncharacterized protein n=1 Tax=Alkanindiges hydrocarboniclasticus TaxID=1907941 RepID=A0A1S8CZX6_9GAMM|nr:hypothetical protein [Alkanindiges hydrocarboniclasticus]ONG42033.1 hypothetical protein BKE30_01855 [Alkanindiges hydrocarboniclasticus]
MNNYPRMLYRPGKGPSEVWGELVDTRIVQSEAEEVKAIREGWLQDPNKACQKAHRKRLLHDKWQKFAKHWQFWITCAIGIMAIVVSYMAIK